MSEAGGAAGAKRPWLLLGYSISQARLWTCEQLRRSLCLGTLEVKCAVAEQGPGTGVCRSGKEPLGHLDPCPPCCTPRRARLTLPKVCRKP
jgi:hypothetical protein